MKIKRLLQGLAESLWLPDDKEGVKLPRLDVPTFNGNLVNWTNFWDQFQISVHNRSQLSNSEKLAYLKHALKESPAKHAIQCLSGSGDHYEEAIKCLKKWYDRPHLTHQAHIRSILEEPTLKDGNGKELLRSKGQLKELEVMQEYFSMNNAKPVHSADLGKPPKTVFYLPMHAVVKESSTTTKICAVFDASAKTSSAVSLSDQTCWPDYPLVSSTCTTSILSASCHGHY